MRYVIYEKQGSVATVTMNRPENLNAFCFFGGDDAAEIWSAFDRAAADDDVKVVIWRGVGRAFCVGHDMTRVGFVYGMGTGKAGERRPSQRIRLQIDRKGTDDSRRLFLHPKLTIAQVHGYCLGGGLWAALLCDMVVAAEDATLGFPEQRLGFAGSGAELTHLVLTAGMKRALDLLLTGRTVTGCEAARMGLVSRAVPAGALEEETRKLAGALTLLPRDGIAIGKATRHLIYDRLGLTSDFTTAYISHTLFTNVRWEADEYNFFRERRNRGTREALHGRDDRYQGLA